MRNLLKGFLRENPVTVLALGLCPALAVSTTVNNALGMSAATVMVLLCSNVMISLLRKKIPEEIHIPAYIVIIATFVTLVELLMEAWAPALFRSLGIFTQLIVVNCIILGRAEAFASKNSVSASAVDALAMGLGFTVSLTAIALIREVLGSGTITLFPVSSLNFDGVLTIPVIKNSPALIFVLPAGALLVMGFLQALFRWLSDQRMNRGSRR